MSPLRARTDRRPVKVGRKGDRDALGNQGVARVGAVILAPKTAHHEGDLLAGLEDTAGRNLIDDADALDSKDPRIREIRVGEAPTRVGLRLVDAESFDAHPHPALPHLGDRELRDPHFIDLTGTFEADDIHQRSISFHGT